MRFGLIQQNFRAWCVVGEQPVPGEETEGERQAREQARQKDTQTPSPTDLGASATGETLQAKAARLAEIESRIKAMGASAALNAAGKEASVPSNGLATSRE